MAGRKSVGGVGDMIVRVVVLDCVNKPHPGRIALNGASIIFVAS